MLFICELLLFILTCVILVAFFAFRVIASLLLTLAGYFQQSACYAYSSALLLIAKMFVAVFVDDIVLVLILQ